MPPRSRLPTSGTNSIRKKQEWRAAKDPKTGRVYYYDIHTRETQWRKPLELASRSEVEKIQEKERKQKDFFKSMESNILKAMQSGQVPGTPVAAEDVVRPLKPIRNKHPSLSICKKPVLIRTISSMNDDLLAELAEDKGDVKMLQHPQISPDSTTSSFFDSLPQPKSSSLTATSDMFPRQETTRIVTPPRNECSGKLPKPSLGKRNTCGSLYISNTMSAPDKEAAIKCVCGVFRTHIIQSSKEPTDQTKFEDYEVFNDDYTAQIHDRFGRIVAPRIVETEAAIEMMSMDDTSTAPSDIPSLEEITQFYRFVFNKSQMEYDCIIMSLIYVERLLRETKGGVRPKTNNWRSVLFSCMVLSSKVWDDLSMWNVDFSQACPVGTHFSLQRINQLELALLTCLKYCVKVPASEYAKYYFLMRSMLIRSGLAGQDILSSSPLDIEGAKKLEFLTSNYKTSPSLHRRSKSVGGMAMDDQSDSPTRSRNSVKLEQVVRM
eukprot:CAMPEP_0197245422 /NCGR_PEP_ID=MMETSP1429-20130617/10219_1 /TAXON_ID=49237 /ORGANISM="Chaetoceros  sp., Strain UNC1202" /LENGTH=490 /DNA_ID=CAMNT_0042705915 /DNA_START=14 /DNA_END=1486 /DNA_ORIENTATION=+